MGLHNRFPSHFYKRGNLFNTYLGYTGPDTRSSASRSRSVNSGKKAAAGTLRPAREQLDRYVRGHLTKRDAWCLLCLLTQSKGEEIEVRWEQDPWAPLSRFIRQRLSAAQAARYLRELRRREIAGEPLVQRAVNPG